MKQKKVLREAKKAAKRQAREARQQTGRPTELCEKVLFSTVELLELVLLQLDMRTILTVAQRVHTHWQKVINTSPAIQQHLFFLPVNHDDDDDDSSPDSTRRPVQNPLLATDFFPFFRTWAPKEDTTIWQHRDRLLPLSFRPTGVITAGSLWYALGKFQQREAGDKEKRHLALTRSDASWRRMLVSQPPPRRIGRVKEWGMDEVRRRWDRRVVEIPDGLRMGDLFDAVDAAIFKRTRKLEKVTWGAHRAYDPGLWIGWKHEVRAAAAQQDEEEAAERLGINPDGRPWRHAHLVWEMPQPSPTGDRWVEQERIDLVIGEKNSKDSAGGRCRGHGRMDGQPVDYWNPGVAKECCIDTGFPLLPGEDRVEVEILQKKSSSKSTWTSWPPKRIATTALSLKGGSPQWCEYDESTARRMFLCHEQNDDLVRELSMEDVGEVEEDSWGRRYRYY